MRPHNLVCAVRTITLDQDPFTGDWMFTLYKVLEDEPCLNKQGYESPAQAFKAACEEALLICEKGPVYPAVFADRKTVEEGLK